MAAPWEKSKFSRKKSNLGKQHGRGRHDKGEIDRIDGRVGRLDDHTMGYYRRVADTIKDGFQDVTEQGLFIDNVFEQMQGEEVKLCQNQTVSRILEDIVRLAGPAHLRGFLDSILGEFEVVVKDRFAGHVLERALRQAVRVLDDEEEGTALQEKVLSFADRLESNLNSIMMDTYGNHILRTVVQILGGVKVPDQIVRSKMSRVQQDKETHAETEQLLKIVPEKLQLSLKKIANSVLKAENFNEYLLNCNSAPVLEVLLLVLHQFDPTYCHRLCQAILKRSKVMTASSQDRIPVVLTDSIGSHLFEVVIQVASPESFSDMYTTCFQDHLLDMALHPVANFVLQKLVKRAATDGEEFLEIFEKLCANIESILGVNHMGLVLRLAEACMLHPTKQREFLRSLLSAFHCWEPKERRPTCVLLIATMMTHNVFFPETTTEDETKMPRLTEVNLHGSLLIQQLLRFTQCSHIIAGYLALSDDDLVTMACDPCGSYLLEAFMGSGAVSDKKRDKFAEKMKSQCVKMACHKTGSRCIEAVFKASSLRAKRELVQNLAEKDEQLQSDYFGKFVYRTCGVGLFKHRQQDWEELQGKESKKRKLFAEIIGDDEDKTTTKKKSTVKPASNTEALLSSFPDEMTALGMGEGSEVDDDMEDICGKLSHSVSEPATSEKRKSSKKKNHKAKKDKEKPVEVTESTKKSDKARQKRKSKTTDAT